MARSPGCRAATTTPGEQQPAVQVRRGRWSERPRHVGVPGPSSSGSGRHRSPPGRPRPLVAGRPQPLQGQLPLAGLVGGHVHVQVGDHQGVQQVGAAQGQGQAGQGAHRLGQHHHLVGVQMPAEELDELDGVGDPAVEGHLPAVGLAGATEGLARPRWSHCTTVKCCSQGRRGRVNTALGQPGPPCRISSSTGLSRSSPRSWIHWSIPPTRTKRCSTIPFGVVISRVPWPPGAGAPCADQAADRRRGDDAGRTSQSFADHGCSPRSPALPCVVGRSKRGPLQGLCPEPGSFPPVWRGETMASGSCRDRRVHWKLAVRP